MLGKRYTGDRHVFTAGEANLHITLDENEDFEKWNDNINSAFCSCVTHRLKYPGKYLKKGRKTIRNHRKNKTKKNQRKPIRRGGLKASIKQMMNRIVGLFLSKG